MLQHGAITTEIVPGAELLPCNMGYLEDGIVRNFGQGPVIIYLVTLTSEPEPMTSPTT